MNRLEDDIRAVLDSQAQAMRVPEPHLESSLTLTRVTAQPAAGRVWMLATAAVLIGVVVAAFVLVERPTDKPASTGGGSSFAAAIEASGVLTSPSADGATQAMDDALYRGDEGTQVSPAGNFVSLRMCRTDAVSSCGTGWAFVTRAAGGVEMQGGLLGEANQLDLHLLDDRYFVASDSLPDTQAPSKAWLIDAVSGKSGTLRWRDHPTTLNSPAQALLVCQDSYDLQCATVPDVEGPVDLVDIGIVPTEGGLPKVVDARDGTIRPLAVPDDVVAGLTVAQPGTGRIWVGTAPDGDTLGLAYTDDGGATWTEVTLPAPLGATSEGLASEDGQLTIAADGDRLAVAKLWRPDHLYVSADAGQSWSTRTLPEPSALGNGAHLYVLADGRLVLTWSDEDMSPLQVFVSTNTDWTEQEKVGVPGADPRGRLGTHFFTVNRTGIALVPRFLDACWKSCRGGDDSSPVLDTILFSPDLTNWTTIETLGD